MKIKINYIYVLILFLLSFISYSNILGNDFVWDDSRFVLNRPETMSFDRAISAFGTDQFDVYRPLRTVTYFFAYSLFNYNSFLYHFLSIIFHFLVSILIFFIIKKLFNKNLALFSSVLFVTHPIHVGRVANITASFDLIGIIFYLLSFYFYLRFREINNNKFFLFSLLVFILALFSSEEAYTLPLLLLLYEFLFCKKYFSTIYYWTSLILFLILRIFVLHIGSRSTFYPGGSFFVSMLTMPKVLLHYILLIFAPFGLTPFRNVDFVTNFNFWFILPLLLIFTAIYFIYKYRSNKTLLFFSGWFILTLLPFLNIAPLQTIMAERYFYLASLSLFVLISFLILLLPKSYKFTILVLITIIFISFTIFNNSFWKDELTLMERGVFLNPSSSQANNNLGNHYFILGDYDKAEFYFSNAVNSDSNNDKAWINLGVLYSSQKKYNESISALNTALELNSYNYIAYEKLGVTYIKFEDYDNAKINLLKSIELSPDYYKAHSKLGALYYNVGDVEKAIYHLHLAMNINSYYSEPIFNMGLILDDNNKPQEAYKYYLRAAQLEPNNPLYLSKVQ